MGLYVNKRIPRKYKVFVEYHYKPPSSLLFHVKNEDEGETQKGGSTIFTLEVN